MGQTMAEKIIARAAGRDSVTPGEYVTVTPDVSVGHEMFWPLHERHMREIGIDRFPHPDKVVLVIDHTPLAALDSPYVKVHQDLRAFVRRTGFRNFFDVGRGGLRHQVMMEQGFARPGLLVCSDEGNIAALGAVGALNFAMSWEVIVPMITDANWIVVPRTTRMRLHGALPFGTMARDLVQVINREFGETDLLLQGCVEFTGPGIASLSMDARQALLSGMYHCGADTAIMELDDTARAYVAERAAGRPSFEVTSDPDASYFLERDYDLSALTPCVTVPPEQHSVVPVAEVQGTRVDHATIGSCAANRIEDLRAAAEVLRGRRIAPHVALYVSPGSSEIFAQAAAEGLLGTLAEAGAMVLAPGCNTCFGYVGALSDGQTAISTQQQNYNGRSGSPEARIFLASPYVVAASAVAGQITDPRELLAEEALA